VVQETEYTGAWKHIQPQLSFARENGIEIRFGDPKEEIPGRNIILPEHPSLLNAKDLDLTDIKKSYIENSLKKIGDRNLKDSEFEFLKKETRMKQIELAQIIKEIGRGDDGKKR
ncbi:MAG: PLP-dependent lyase/thiolase, partial [Clostridiales bacterium]